MDKKKYAKFTQQKILTRFHTRVNATKTSFCDLVVQSECEMKVLQVVKDYMVSF